MQLNTKDLKFLNSHGLCEAEIEKQLDFLQRGIQYIKLSAPALLNDGILSLGTLIETLITFNNYNINNNDVIRFVPASGAATRMFKDLNSESANKIKATFKNKFYQLPFSTLLHKQLRKEINSLDENSFTKKVMSELKLANYPKGLIPFHWYGNLVKTAFQEQLDEWSTITNSSANIHFTIPHFYQAKIKEHLENYIQSTYKNYSIGYSFQESSTSTLSINTNNIIRDDDGYPLLRPGGHGALLQNLENLNSKVIHIKNIDNIAPQRLRADSEKYIKLMLIFLTQLKSEIDIFMHDFDEKNLDKTKIHTMAQLIEKFMFLKIDHKANIDVNSHALWIYNLLNRPLRICAMVKNQGAAGGGPFWVKNQDGGNRLQIVEKNQVNLNDESQKQIFEKSAFFNPVNIVCTILDHKGKKFQLSKFRHDDSAFLTQKSHKGKKVIALERPGLWNGSMAYWNSVFVELPLSTFTPVKTFLDLLNSQHFIEET